MHLTQVPIQIYDTAWPNNRVTKILTVNVTHNANSPVFTGPMTAVITDSDPLGSVVLTLLATDADGVSIFFVLHFIKWSAPKSSGERNYKRMRSLLKNKPQFSYL